jgi:hypothetical protein
MRLAGWSPRHSVVIEQSLRAAGVHVYASDQAGLAMLRELLSDDRARAGPQHAHGPPANVAKTRLSGRHPP